MVRLIGGGEHLGLVDVVHPDRLQHLGLGEMPDPALGHDGDGHRGDDPVDHVGVAHPGHAALSADVGGHALQGHHRDGAGILGDLGLIGRDNVHDDAALQHVGHAPLDPLGPRPRSSAARGTAGTGGSTVD